MIRLISLAALAFGGVLATHALPAQAHHWSGGHANNYGNVYGQAPMPVPAYPASPYANTAASPYSNSAYPDPWQQAQQRQRDCNRGRLIGGIVGGGLGYAASRDDGRSWAVPLGALLGSQVGCNTGAGRGPLPW